MKISLALALGLVAVVKIPGQGDPEAPRPGIHLMAGAGSRGDRSNGNGVPIGDVPEAREGTTPGASGPEAAIVEVP